MRNIVNKTSVPFSQADAFWAHLCNESQSGDDGIATEVTIVGTPQKLS